MARILTKMAKERGFRSVPHLIANAIENEDGNVAAACRKLGVQQSAVQYWLPKLEITRRTIATVRVIGEGER